MPKTTKSGKAKQDEIPSTLQRSDEKAQRTFAKTHDSAMDSYDDERRANQTAWAAVKHTHEKVGAYERISDDKEEEARGVARQAADNEALSDLRGWKIAEHYQDNDVSAFKENIVRPAFERLLADLESGVLDGVVVYDQDRFVRQPSDLERAIRVY